MEASLNLAGKIPWENERLARVAIISENTSGQSLINDVRMKSTEEDFDGMDEINFNTSSAVTSVTESKGSPK